MAGFRMQVRDLTVLLFAASIVSPAAADSTAGSEPQQPDVAAGVDEILVRGSRAVGIFADETIQIEVFDLDRIQALPAVSAADVLAFTPGLRIQGRVQGEEAAVSVEGLPPEYTRLLVDNDHYAGELGSVGDLTDFPIANVGRIELLRGPQSLRYGADASGGIVNLITRQPPADDGARLTFESQAGDEGLLYSGLGSSMRVGDWSSSFSVVHDQTNGFDPRGSDAVFISGNGDSRRRIEDVYGTVRYEMSESGHLFARGGWRYDEEGEVFDLGVGGERSYQRSLSELGIAHELGSSSRGELSFRRHQARTRSELGREFRMDEVEWAIRGHIESDLESAGFDHRIRLGFDSLMPSLEQSEVGIAPDVLQAQQGLEEVNTDLSLNHDSDERFTLSGIYLDWEVPVTNMVTLQLGARGVFHSAYADRVVSQAALLLQPLDTLKLRFGWGTGYRTPSLRELYQPPVTQNGGSYFLSGNPDLQPASTAGLRAGFEYTATDQFFLAANLYWNEIDDHIRSAQDPNDPTIVIGSTVVQPGGGNPICEINPRFPGCDGASIIVPQTRSLFRKTNFDRVKTRGAEVRLEWRPIDDLRFRTGYTFMKTHVSSPNLALDELPNEPRHSLDLEVWAALPVLNSEMTLRARWRDEAIPDRVGTGTATFADPGDRTDRSWVVEARIRKRFGSRVEVFLDGRNLTNQETIDSYEIRGRRVSMGIRLELEEISW